LLANLVAPPVTLTAFLIFNTFVIGTAFDAMAVAISF